MIRSIKSEIRKLLSVRSTYVVMGIALFLVGLTSFYLEGYWGQTGSAASTLQPTAIMEILRNNLGVIAMFVSIVAILQMGHEYRHGTIMYTLTLTPRRTKVFTAKSLVTIGFALTMSLILMVAGVLLYKFGLSLRGVSLPAQELNLASELPRFCLYIIIYGLLGLFISVLIRNLIGAVVLMLIYPTTIEPLLGLLLKDNSMYLPVSTFDHMIGVAIQQNDAMSPNKAVVFSIIYITILGVIAWISFVRRDAN